MARTGSKILAAVFIAVCAVVAGVFLFYQALNQYWHQHPIEFESEHVFRIERGESIASVLSRLDDHATNLKTIEQQSFFPRLAMRLFANTALIKSGEYVLHGQYSRAASFELFATGQSKQYRLTLVDGHTTKQMIAAVEEAYLQQFEMKIDIEQLQSELSQSLDARAIELMQGANNLEGWFFPETYFFTRDSKPEETFQRAHVALVDVLEAEWEGRAADLPLRNPYEALILASIIERESGHIDERKQIAGVFIRRLNKGMKLQTDPTVIYGMGEAYQGNITRRDLQRDTPFNTYTRAGLPPTPIANPGRASIHAALNPAHGSALYFVAKGDGSHQFSATLEEHNRAVRRYQILQRRADYRSAPQP